MTGPRRIPAAFWRILRTLNSGVRQRYPGIRRMQSLVLLLTTTGRKSGISHVTPLQYEDVDGVIFVASARGAEADWFRNLQADPHVKVQVGAASFEAVAEPILDPARIADLLEIRLARHPKMIGGLLRAEGLPRRHTRRDLEEFSRGKAAAALRRVAPS